MYSEDMIYEHKQLGRELCRWAGLQYVGCIDGEYTAQREVKTKGKQIDEQTWEVDTTIYEVFNITTAMINYSERI